ncbi:Transcription regulator [contains diacylglycerol kinase catalytic domain] [Granulicella sibirica]|uniref:Transcription regulator [contains diacylglycerol kinase catalytic domain] n=2 Tax=Granulicella sibirica TaxID=2479048 RepID=A0A4Q0T537_9BACT|nr:diacylglycerol kinase family protein [Granulicella sibirica]RXH58813.1 Transcription regulator [contains diacylglycerol kinase catalytic domain] [Granulicella sibirica]
MNERSGGCAGRRGEVEAAFRESGLRCEVTSLRPRMDVAKLVREAARRPETLVVAAGGDGTISAVASAMAGSGAPMGVLAMGTLNHFAKDLGLPAALMDEAKVIAEGEARSVDLGEVNGRFFVNNSSVGFYPGMVLHRERLKKVGWNKWLSLLVASARAFVRFKHISVCVSVPGEERMMRMTPFVFVGNNEYCMEGSEAGTRKKLDAGKLYLYMAPGATRRSLLRLTFAALMRRVHEVQQDPHFESYCVEEFTVDLRRRVSHVSLDGEIVRLKGPLQYRIRPGALKVMAPVPVVSPVVEELSA